MAQANDPTVAEATKSDTSEETSVDTASTEAADSALDDLMSKHTSDPESAPPKRARGENGRFASGSESKSEDTSASEAQTGQDADYHKAMAALKRDGYPEPEAFAKAQPESFVAFGLKRAKVQVDVDSYTDELKTAKQQLVELKKQQTKEAPATDDGTQPASAEQQSKIADIAEPLVKVFDELLGEDVGDPLRKAFAGLAERIVSDVQQVIETKLSALSEATEQTALREARKSLTKKWPKLAEDDRYQAVLKHLKRLGDDAELPDAEARLDYACAVEFAPDLVKEAQKVIGDRNQWRDNGKPSTESPTTSPSGAKTHQELSDASLQARIDRDPAKAEQHDNEMQRRRFAALA